MRDYGGPARIGVTLYDPLENLLGGGIILLRRAHHPEKHLIGIEVRLFRDQLLGGLGGLVDMAGTQLAQNQRRAGNCLAALRRKQGLQFLETLAPRAGIDFRGCDHRLERYVVGGERRRLLELFQSHIRLAHFGVNLAEQGERRRIRRRFAQIVGQIIQRVGRLPLLSAIVAASRAPAGFSGTRATYFAIASLAWPYCFSRYFVSAWT